MFALFSNHYQIKVIAYIFRILSITCAICSFWNAGQLILAGICGILAVGISGENQKDKK